MSISSHIKSLNYDTFNYDVGNINKKQTNKYC